MSRPFHHPSVGQPAAVLTVSELNDIIRDRLETGLDALWVAGELSNVRFAPSGHVYFTLKDSESQIAAVLFRRNAERLRFRLEDGMEVVCSGRVGLYTVRGVLQFYAVEVEARGKGALTVAFEQLKKRLWREGLFESERKKPLPFLPRTVGIVTSLQGAAVRDMLSIIGERFPERRVIIRPVKVQGQGSALEIAQGIRELDETGVVDVIIVGRGGGSLEDLWAFNEEAVARAIAAARTPVVSAVGHEIDVTIADFVADQRAATPTAAAEMILPRRRELEERMALWARRLRRGAENRMERRRENLRYWALRLADPGRGLRQGQMRLDELSLRLWRRQEDAVLRVRERLGHLAGRLGGVDPLAVLRRGYSIVYDVLGGRIVKDAASLGKGQQVRVDFAAGRAFCRVEEVEAQGGVAEPSRAGGRRDGSEFP